MINKHVYNTFGRLSQLYCFGASSVLLVLKAVSLTSALAAVTLTLLVASSSISDRAGSLSGDFLLDFLEKKHPISATNQLPVTGKERMVYPNM